MTRERSSKIDHETVEITSCSHQPKISPKWAGNFADMDLANLRARAMEVTWDVQDGIKVGKMLKDNQGVTANYTWWIRSIEVWEPQNKSTLTEGSHRKQPLGGKINPEGYTTMHGTGKTRSSTQNAGTKIKVGPGWKACELKLSQCAESRSKQHYNDVRPKSSIKCNVGPLKAGDQAVADTQSTTDALDK